MATLDSKKTSDPEAYSSLLAENAFDMDVESGAVHNSQSKPVYLSARLRDSVCSEEFRDFVLVNIHIYAAMNAFFGAMALVLNLTGAEDDYVWSFFKSFWIILNFVPITLYLVVFVAVGMYKLTHLII